MVTVSGDAQQLPDTMRTEKFTFTFYCPSVILYHIFVSGNVIQNGRQDLFRAIGINNQ